MTVFLDTGNIDEIKKYHEYGIIRGVTTNPSILVKEDLGSSIEDIKYKLIEIADLIKPLPLSIEVTSNDLSKMTDEAELFSSWASNINIKITIHGPDGELDNLKVINTLENKKNIRVNVTAMMSAQQCYLAAQAGASYVSIFGGRINNMGYDSIDEIKILRNLLDKFNLKSKIIVGSTREVLNVVQWLNAGDIVTCHPSFLEGMLIHPYTKETVRMFLDDAKKIKK
jgi:transaldolase